MIHQGKVIAKGIGREGLQLFSCLQEAGKGFWRLGFLICAAAGDSVSFYLCISSRPTLLVDAKSIFTVFSHRVPLLFRSDTSLLPPSHISIPSG
jgi:hypothetical protein